MGTLTPKLLYIGNASGSNVYTVSNTSGSYTILRNINICSTISSQTLLQVSIVPPSGSASANTRILNNFAVGAHETVSYDAGIVLQPGYSINVAHNGSLTLTISGVEFSP